MRFVAVEAPTRIDFAGGPTDVRPFRDMEGGYVTSAAFRYKANAEIRERADSEIHVFNRLTLSHTIFENVAEVRRNISQVSVLEACISATRISGGFDLITDINVPTGSGLGTSSAMCVAALTALRIYETGSTKVNLEDIVEQSLYVENEILQNIAGGQDQLTSVYGGFRFFEFLPDTVRNRRLKVEQTLIDELEERSVVCFTGISRTSGKILNGIMERYSKGEPGVVDALRRMKQAALRVSGVLESGDVDGFADEMREVEEIQDLLGENIMPLPLINLRNEIRQHGVVASRMVGAGGGGCMYFVCHEGARPQAEKYLERHGAKIINTKFCQDGLIVTDYFLG